MKIEVYLEDEGFEATLKFDIQGKTRGTSALIYTLSLVEMWEFRTRNVTKGKVSLDNDDFVDALYLVNEKGETLQQLRYKDSLSSLVVGTKIAE